MKRCQTAVPTIILTVMVLLIWYLLWIYPQQRYELLFGDQEVVDTTDGVSTALFETTIGEIGQSSGELLDTQIISDMSVNYPVTRSLIASYENEILNSNLIASEYKTIDLSNADSDEYSIEILAGSVTGTPNLVATLNTTSLYNAQLFTPSTTLITFTKGNIETYGDILRITCQFSGFEFWTTQQCGFDEINVYKSVFYAQDIDDNDIFYLTQTSRNAELIELSFSVNETTDYPVEILINNNSIFNGILTQGDITLSLDGEDLDLDIDNTFSLIADEGAVYSLSNIEMQFSSVPSGMAEKYIVFNIPEDELDEEEITLTFELLNIIEPGNLILEITNTDTTYQVLENDLVVGENIITISTNDLDEIGNNMKIYSTSGRLIIGDLTIG